MCRVRGFKGHSSKSCTGPGLDLGAMQLVYKEAAKALSKLQERCGSLKYIIFNRRPCRTLTFRKRVYAVAVETLKRERAVVCISLRKSKLLGLL